MIRMCNSDAKYPQAAREKEHDFYSNLKAAVEGGRRRLSTWLGAGGRAWARHGARAGTNRTSIGRCRAGV